MYIYAKMKTIKNEKYLYTVIFCYSHVPSCKRELNGGLNSVLYIYIYICIYMYIYMFIYIYIYIYICVCVCVCVCIYQNKNDKE